MNTSTTQWTVSVGKATPSAFLRVSIDGGPPIGVKLKGVCYSPCPINGSNNYAPALGDWFWDSITGSGYSIEDWHMLWNRDLPNIRTLGANSIRVYNLMSRQIPNGQYPVPWNSGQLFEHYEFLDLCWNNGQDPLYVMASVAMPQEMFWKQNYQPESSETEFWTNVLQETAAQIGSHPAILGIIIQNEQDSNVVTYPNSQNNNLDDVEFWWSQVEAMAKIAKAAAPNKLVGMAVHDDPNICLKAATYMAQCPDIDFWGVNTYQPQTFKPVFGSKVALGSPTQGYNSLSGVALKPVILTEYGFPATTRDYPCQPEKIYVNETTIGNTASVLNNMLSQAYAEPLNLGLYYFEYCDEWWNQSGYTIPGSCNSQKFQPPNIYTPYGGPPATGFPNGYWDQDGFGLYQPQRGQGKQNSDPIWCNNNGVQEPCTPIDTMNPRNLTINAVKNAFSNI